MAIRVTRVFGIPLAKVRVPETEELKRKFLPEMLRRYENRHYRPPPMWETDRVHSSYDAERSDLVIDFTDAMPAAYDRLLRQFVPEARFDLQLWHNVYWHGEEYQERHHHVPCHLSFIHFLAFDPAEHRRPIFYDPSRMIKAYCRHDVLPPEMWEDKAEIDVAEGDALVFPSYLEHEALRAHGR
jgi:hypothetical protein